MQELNNVIKSKPPPTHSKVFLVLTAEYSDAAPNSANNNFIKKSNNEKNNFPYSPAYISCRP